MRLTCVRLMREKSLETNRGSNKASYLSSQLSVQHLRPQRDLILLR
jgi:hypothetical protein